MPEHALKIRLQPWQRDTILTEAHANSFAKGECAWTCLNVENEPVACAGILPIWHNRGLAWALLGEDVGPYMREVTRNTKAALDQCPYRRIELYARPDFPESIRWARMLGFEYEAMLDSADPSGGDMALFKRIKRPERGTRLLKGV